MFNQKLKKNEYLKKIYLFSITNGCSNDFEQCVVFTIRRDGLGL